jgi:hypothetical protein
MPDNLIPGRSASGRMPAGAEQLREIVKLGRELIERLPQKAKEFPVPPKTYAIKPLSVVGLARPGALDEDPEARGAEPKQPAEQARSLEVVLTRLLQQLEGEAGKLEASDEQEYQPQYRTDAGESA